MTGEEPRPRLITPAFVTLIASGLCYSTAVGVMIPVLPLFVVDELGASATAVGVAVGLFSVTALLLKPVAGRAADRWGRRALLVGGSALFTIVVAGHLLVSEYWALVGLRVLLGAAEAVTFVAGVAALTDLAPPERLGEAISYDSVGLFLGIAFGPIIGEWLLGQGGFPTAWAGAVALGGAATLLATRLPSSAGPDGAGGSGAAGVAAAARAGGGVRGRGARLGRVPGVRGPARPRHRHGRGGWGAVHLRRGRGRVPSGVRPDRRPGPRGAAVRLRAGRRRRLA